MRRLALGIALVLATACGGGDKAAPVSSTTSTTTKEQGVIATCNGRYPPNGPPWSYCVDNDGAPAPDWLTTTATTTTTAPEPTTTTVAVNADFVSYARQLGVADTDQSIQTLGDGVCVFARKGPAVFTGYVATLAPAAGLARQWFSSIMVAASLKLCPDVFSVIQPEVRRLAGN